jgi:hypothetical protein
METRNFQALQSGFEFADINKLSALLHDVDEGLGIQVHGGTKKARGFAWQMLSNFGRESQPKCSRKRCSPVAGADSIDCLAGLCGVDSSLFNR